MLILRKGDFIVKIVLRLILIHKEDLQSTIIILLEIKRALILYP